MTHRGRASEVSKTKKPQAQGPRQSGMWKIVELFLPRMSQAAGTGCQCHGTAGCREAVAKVRVIPADQDHCTVTTWPLNVPTLPSPWARV